MIMVNPGSVPVPVSPYLISVLGLKKSGKTAVGEGLIASLRARGYTVAAMKSSHLRRLDLDREAADSSRLAAAGADYLLVHTAGEILTLERREHRAPFAELLAGVPSRIQFIVSEGGEADRADAVVLCLKKARDVSETVGTRRVPQARILALSGLIGSSRSPPIGEHKDIPVFDIRDANQRESLTDLILRRAGSPPPAGPPAGPLARDPGWLPG